MGSQKANCWPHWLISHWSPRHRPPRRSNVVIVWMWCHRMALPWTARWECCDPKWKNPQFFPFLSHVVLESFIWTMFHVFFGAINLAEWSFVSGRCHIKDKNNVWLSNTPFSMLKLCRIAPRRKRTSHETVSFWLNQTGYEVTNGIWTRSLGGYVLHLAPRHKRAFLFCATHGSGRSRGAIPGGQIEDGNTRFFW